MMTKKMIDREEEIDFSYSSLGSVRDEIQKLIEKYGEKASFMVLMKPDYGCDRATSIVMFQTEETDKEYKARITVEANQKLYRRKQYEQMKKEFED